MSIIHCSLGYSRMDFLSKVCFGMLGILLKRHILQLPNLVTLQKNLLGLCKNKNPSSYLFFISSNFEFLPYECPGLCQHRLGHS